MSLRNVSTLKMSYNTLTDDLARDFYIPCLKEAIEYKRAVGYFSSNVLLEISEGLGAFADHHGKMKLLVSPNLDEEDYDAISKGYDIKEKINQKLIDSFDFDIEFDQKEDRFKMLAYMIATDLLEIKIVVVKQEESGASNALFHRKTGIFTDEFENKIAFSGSGNETLNGLVRNDEEWDVYASWTSEDSDMRCMQKEFSFDQVWDDEGEHLIVIPFPDVIKNKILSFGGDTQGQTNFSDIDEKFLKKYISSKAKEEVKPHIPEGLLYDYQIKAVEKWKEQDYRGVFSMATGTGKTFAACGAICQLYEDKKRLIVVICCPQKTLVEQWGDELLKFNIESIKCYSDINYQTKLIRLFNEFRHKDLDFICVVTTNATFQKDCIQDLLKDYLDDVLVVVDEAHNFGADKISETMTANYHYRLALSATFERYRDEEGTQKLLDFFGEKCIDYSLEQAILDGKLCEYSYYPVCCYLSEREYEEYMQLSEQYSKIVAKFGVKNGNGTITFKDKYSRERAEQILIKRARLVSGVTNKLDALKDYMQDYKDDTNILVYSGSYIYEDGTRQIDAVQNVLINDLEMKSVKFTAEEDSETRKQIISDFKDEFIQAIVAINCLDEGIDIPAIRTAFILASTTNPRQYIQRRGRVLRTSPGKSEAKIYDFIVLPHPLGSNLYRNSDFQNYERGLVNKEITRMKEFSDLSRNPSMYVNLYCQIRDEYELNLYHEEDYDYVF